MTLFFSHIPYVIWENLLLMAVLFFVYILVDHLTDWKPSIKFNIAASFQIVGGIQFVYLFLQPNYKESAVISYNGLNNLNLNWLLPYFGIIYVIVLFVYLFQLVIQYFHLQRVRHFADFSVQNKWLKQLNSTPFYIPSKLKIGVSQHVQSPVVFGFLEPIILLPISMCTYLSANQIKLILIHELAHIHRFDFLIHVLLKSIECLLWFNPFAKLLQKSLELQREMACDALVMCEKEDPIKYSKALFKIAKNSQISKLNLSLGAYASHSELLLRIQYLNKIQIKRSLNFGLFGLIPLLLAFNIFFLQVPYEKKKVYKPTSFLTATAITNIESSRKSQHANKNTIINRVKPRKNHIENNIQLAIINNSVAEKSIEQLHYNDLLNETKSWVRSLESPVKYVGFNENASKQDSLENAYIERILMSTIIKNYQLKKTLLEQKLGKASNINEASDYLINSKEWNDIQQYQQWVREYLQKQ